MSHADTRDMPLTLLPHQAALVETLLDPSTRTVVLLRGDVGLGKGAALIGAATRLLNERPASRVLAGCRRVAASVRREIPRQWRARTTGGSLSISSECSDEVSGLELWRPGTVAVLSFDFAS